MSLRRGKTIWHARLPHVWPPAPADMTVTSLREIETCSRRWALASAEYPDIWRGHGYPPRIHKQGLVGSVIHLALMVVTDALAESGCPSVYDASAASVLRDLGGYSRVIAHSIERLLEPYADNPRVKHLLGPTRDRLRAEAPDIRSKVQALLVRLDVRTRSPVSRDAHSPGNVRRGPLRPGTHAEILLRAKSLGWRGRADIVTLWDSGCGLVDFKTGRRSDWHDFQIRVYALLWHLDEEVNPQRTVVTRLTLSYPDADVEVEPPTLEELDAIAREITERRRSAEAALGERPPKVSISLQSCLHCDVRHLCEEYWQPLTQQAQADEVAEERGVADIEVTLVGPHGPASWDAVVLASRGIEPGTPIVLRTPMNHYLMESVTGDRIRVLDARFLEDAYPGPLRRVVGVTSASEVFLVA